MLKKLLIAFFLISSIFISCQQAPDGKGTLVVESDDDNYTIKEVYARKAGEAVWELIWSDSNSNISWTHANIYLDPGNYYIRAKMCYLNTFYALNSTAFATVTINEGDTTFVYARLSDRHLYQ